MRRSVLTLIAPVGALCGGRGREPSDPGARKRGFVNLAKSFFQAELVGHCMRALGLLCRSTGTDLCVA